MQPDPAFAPVPSPSSTAAGTDAPLLILHLEDSDLDAELARARLARGGVAAAIDRVHDRDEYERCLTEKAYDLVLSDYHLPAYDGLSALGFARERRPDVPFVFLTGALGEETAVDLLRRGATDYILKQRMDRLAPAVVRAVAEARERAARRAAEAEREELLVREKAARLEAEAANRLKDEFLAVASHELRTPLNAILGWASILQSPAGRGSVAEGAAIIHRNARHQAKLIEDILDASRIIAGQLRLNAVPTDLAEVVRRATETVRTAADAKGVSVLVDLPDVDPVPCDPERMEQVVWNLVSNAIKFTPAGGHVAVSVGRSAAGAATIAVTDTGTGIDPDFLPFVFDRFRQSDGSTTRRHGGLGLGLAIVRHLVELHGGTVTAHSDGLGRGARFTVELPTPTARHDGADGHALARPGGATAAAAKDDDCPPSLDGLRVLVLDDDPDARQLVRAVLERCGATVECASSVAEAMAIVARHGEPDVAVSDIGMPEEDGYAFIRQLRAREDGQAREGGKAAARRIATAALTAYTRAEDQCAALSAGFDAFLAKPVEPSQLLTLVADLGERGSRA